MLVVETEVSRLRTAIVDRNFKFSSASIMENNSSVNSLVSSGPSEWLNLGTGASMLDLERGVRWDGEAKAKECLAEFCGVLGAEGAKEKSAENLSGQRHREGTDLILWGWTWS